VIGAIPVDGGGIVVTPGGRVIHVPPPRPDPLAMVDSVAASSALLQLAFSDRVRIAEGVSGDPAHMVDEIAEKEPRRQFEQLAGVGGPLSDLKQNAKDEPRGEARR
jgi:hypothetical protein